MAIVIREDRPLNNLPGKIVEKHQETGGSRQFSVDLSTWKEFQDGLAVLMDVPLSLYSGSGELLVPPRKGNPLCTAIGSRDIGKSRCNDSVFRAIANAVEKDKVYIFKCHANQYIFAVPVVLDPVTTLVIIGGHVYLAGTEEKEFSKGVAPFRFDDITFARLRKEIKTIPPKSIFTIPNIVSNLAVPFLKNLYALRAVDKNLAAVNIEKNRVKGLRALEEVYRAIASVLDREELYETILNKSSELVGAERGSLMILDNKNNVLSVKASRGIDREIVERLRVKIGEGISGSIAARGLPVMVRNIETEVPPRKNGPAYKTKSFISIPIKLENKVIGVINVSDKLSGGPFSEEDLYLLLSFANYASIALERGAYYSMSEELKTISMTDPLTGLFNRRYFRERLFEEVERVKRHNECFTTFMIDIDNFKSFNDRYGHVGGDEILKGVAHSIRDAVRSMDVVSRYGGEEFAVLLPHTDKKDAFIIAERIRKNVEEHRPRTDSFKDWPTISLGIAEFPGDSVDIDDLINNADRAMYTAKRTGKNRVVLYEG